MNIALADLFSAHVTTLQSRAKNVLARENMAALVIHSGKELKVFLDDISYPFKANPHFKHWLPLGNVTNCWLIIDGVNKPRLIYYQPVDFWHQITELPNDFWNDEFSIEIIHQATNIEKTLPYDKARLAYLGEHIEVAKALGFEHINPEPVLNYLHFHRAYKTPYEHECLRRANALAAKGHNAAYQAFQQGLSEFDIQQHYLQTILQTQNETPYQNIIAINENAAILHYTGLNRIKPKLARSFLIDAGATYLGYGADITRTYSKSGSLFHDLIIRVDELTKTLAQRLKPGISYVDLHLEACREIANILIEFKIITVTSDTALESGLVSRFFPHGLGHHLGLQTHDVGGFMIDERGTSINAPAEHPFLRTTRQVEVNQVVTIEPGVYFISSLLSDLKASADATMVNWQIIEQLMFYGGIRIEDNIIVHQSHNENITRANKIN